MNDPGSDRLLRDGSALIGERKRCRSKYPSFIKCSKLKKSITGGCRSIGIISLKCVKKV